MNRQNINRICATVPLILSLMACVWVLGNVAGGARAGGGEGIGFKIFWLLIVAQMPFVLGYLTTADWNRNSKVATGIALQLTALVLAFSPVAYFKL
jgi:hypothetical protein